MKNPAKWRGDSGMVGYISIAIKYLSNRCQVKNQKKTSLRDTINVKCKTEKIGKYVKYILLFDMKRCSKCKQEKEPFDFPKNTRFKDGLHYYCHVCYDLIRDMYRSKDNESEEARHQRLHQTFSVSHLNDYILKAKNQQEAREARETREIQRKVERKAEKEARKEARKQAREKRREEQKKIREEKRRVYQSNNKAKRRVYQNNKYRTDIKYKILHILRARLRVALKYVKAKKSQRTLALLGCDLPTFKVYLESKFLPGMSWGNHGFRGWHVDHIRPCASFDLTDPKQQETCFHYSNLQPLWAKDNLSKNSKWSPIGLFA